MELQRGNLKQRDWQDVMAALQSMCGEGYSYTRCRNKMDSLKKMFKIVKEKKGVGVGVGMGMGVVGGSRSASKWKWFDKMEKLMDRTPPAGQGIPGGIASGERYGTMAGDSDNDVEVSEDEDVESEGQDMTAESTQTPFHGMQSSGLEHLRDDLGMRDIHFCGLVSNLHTKLEGATPETKTSSLPGVSGKAMKRKRKGSLHSPGRHAKEMARMVIDALEKMESKRLEVEEKRMEMMKDLEIRRNETHLQIAKLIIESNMHLNPRHFSFQGQSNDVDADHSS
ncbi:hypothetical protein O6H91_07G124000 [Diphasiastrum complanatum]|nr:hypothetical protein O6H91_07G124000 [Diphasiastrum complanatum]